MSLRGAVRIAIVLATVVSAWLTAAKLHVSSDLTTLFPTTGDAAALARFTRAFAAGNVAPLLLEGGDPDDVAAAAKEAVDALRERPTVARIVDRAPPHDASLDPSLAWAFAGPTARAHLARALTPDGMRDRLAETRSLLLAPGSGEIEDLLARDPLRLAAIPFEGRSDLADGVHPGPDGEFVADDGHARLLLLQPRGSAFASGAAKAFVDDVDAALVPVRAAHPHTSFALTGGHAIAWATESMLRRDFELSGTLSIGLASLVFLLAFHRARALVAVLPPLVVGTLWTTGIAAFWPGGLAAVAVAFMAVVVGVGVDTGVHVYAALLDARRRGLSPDDAADAARRATWRPTLTAALVAALAFGALGLSDLAAMKQLGLLCGAGELLTSVAILALTPEIGARLERGAPPPIRGATWLAWAHAVAATPLRARITLAAMAIPVVAILVVGWPHASDAIVAIRPKGLAPLVTQDEVYRLFGGRSGQWIVVTSDVDADRARDRADAVADALDPLAHDLDGYDALTTFAPSERTVRARLAERDALDLPAAAARLDDALRDPALAFDHDGFAGAVTALAHPATDVPRADLASDSLAWLAARHIAKDGDETLVATFVRSTGDPERDRRALAAIHAADPRSVVTGFPLLDAALRASLTRDLPRVGIVALAVAAIALGATLRKGGHVVLALAVVAVEIAALGVAMRIFGIHWHAYDALVVPVLIGVTLDESMFLLYGATTPEEALRVQGPLVTTTALTTASGFAALLVCRYPGLFDVGAVGALGVVFGWLAALFVVGAGLRLWR
jgi:uncharacterized protein